MRLVKGDRRWWLPWLAVLAMLACHRSTAPAAPVSKPAEARREPLDPSLVPPFGGRGGDHVYCIHIGELFATPEMADTARAINEFLAKNLKQVGFPCNFPVRVQDVDQISGRIMFQIATKEPARGSLTMGLTAVCMKSAQDWVKMIHAELPKAKEINHDGVSYYEANWQPPAGIPLPPVIQLYAPDDHTIVVESGTVEKLIEAKKRPAAKPAWAPAWEAVEGGLLAIAFSDPKHTYADLLSAIPPTLGIGDEARHQSEMIEKVCRKASHLVVGVETRGGFRIRAVFTCEKAEDAVELEKVCAEVRKMIQASADAPSEPASKPSANEKAFMALQRALASSLSVERMGKQVIVTSASKKHGSEALVLLLQGIGGSEPAPAPARPQRERPWLPAGSPPPAFPPGSQPPLPPEVAPVTGPGR
jgi:hypothetical protein